MKKTLLLVLSAIILCLACAAHAAGKEPPAFASVRDVLERTEGYLEIVGGEEYIVLILEEDGRYIRMAALTDDHAKDLYQAATGEDYSVSAMEAYNDYTYTLPFSYMEELDDTPMNQAELDGLKGKTVQELFDEGFGEEIINQDEIGAPVHIFLEKGLFRYEFELDHAASGDPRIMTVRSGKYYGFSRSAFDVDLQENLSGPQ